MGTFSARSCRLNRSTAAEMSFAGTVYSRGGTAEAGGPIELPHGDSLDGSEGLVLRILGDSQPYTLIVRTGAWLCEAGQQSPRMLQQAAAAASAQ